MDTATVSVERTVTNEAHRLDCFSSQAKTISTVSGELQENNTKKPNCTEEERTNTAVKTQSAICGMFHARFDCLIPPSHQRS